MRRLDPLFVLLLAFSTFDTQAAEPRPGLWNLSVTTMAEGAAQTFGPYNSSQCLSQEDIRNPEKLLANNGAADCSYGNKQYQGSRFSFTVQCGGAIPMSGSGNVTYTADTLQGDVDITADLQGLEVATKSQVSGTRVGDCTPDQK